MIRASAAAARRDEHITGLRSISISTSPLSSGGGVSDPKAISDEGHIRQFLDITEAIDARRKPAIDAVEARKAVELVLAIYESAAKNRIIYL